jgi:DNA-directed RNA polymerase specialized sigma24 family protein
MTKNEYETIKRAVRSSLRPEQLHLVEDVTQDVALRIWQAAPATPDEAQLYAYARSCTSAVMQDRQHKYADVARKHRKGAVK